MQKKHHTTVKAKSHAQPAENSNPIYSFLDYLNLDPIIQSLQFSFYGWLLLCFSVTTLAVFYPDQESLATDFTGNLSNVTITDSTGLNSAPTAHINFSIDGDTINLDAKGSTDSDGTIVSYVWDFGDGTTASGETASYQSSSPDPYITLTVEDDKGGIALTHITINTSSPVFSDNFSSDTTADYTVIKRTTAGTNQFLYDADNGGHVLTGDNATLEISQAISSTDTGIFSLYFRPTVKYPAGGFTQIILKENDNRYYSISNTDGYGARGLSKFIGGVEVDTVPFTREYTQGNNYHILIKFSPSETIVEAFGEVITINTNTAAIMVGKFELINSQQDGYYNNIEYSDRQ